jgi:hypothetical protein
MVIHSFIASFPSASGSSLSFIHSVRFRKSLTHSITHPSIFLAPGSSLEQIHIFAIAHILRRPIVVYGIKYVKSYRGENLGFARFQGVYLPLLWEQSFCWKNPICLGYTRGHFSALVPMEIDLEGK